METEIMEKTKTNYDKWKKWKDLLEQLPEELEGFKELTAMLGPGGSARQCDEIARSLMCLEENASMDEICFMLELRDGFNKLAVANDIEPFVPMS